MARKRNALEVLRKRVEGDPELRELVEEERVNLQVALAIRIARDEAGLTQKELAEMVGTTQSVISRLEDADYEGHTRKTLERIAKTLKRRLIIRLAPDVQVIS